MFLCCCFKFSFLYLFLTVNYNDMSYKMELCNEILVHLMNLGILIRVSFFKICLEKQVLKCSKTMATKLYFYKN